MTTQNLLVRIKRTYDPEAGTPFNNVIPTFKIVILRINDYLELLSPHRQIDSQQNRRDDRRYGDRIVFTGGEEFRGRAA